MSLINWTINMNHVKDTSAMNVLRSPVIQWGRGLSAKQFGVQWAAGIPGFEIIMV